MIDTKKIKENKLTKLAYTKQMSLNRFCTNLYPFDLNIFEKQ